MGGDQALSQLNYPCTIKTIIFLITIFGCGRTRSVGRALDCRAGGHRFNSWGWTNTQGLKITEKVQSAYALQMAGPSHGSDDHIKMAVPSPARDVKILTPISTFVLNTLTLKKSARNILEQN